MAATPFVVVEIGLRRKPRRKRARRNWIAAEAIEATAAILRDYPDATSREVMNYLGLGSTRSAKRYMDAARMIGTTNDQTQLCPSPVHSTT
jgi:hypothetical protein